MIFPLYNYFPRRNIEQLSIKEKDFSLKNTIIIMGVMVSSKIKKELALICDYIYTAKFKQAEELIEKILTDKETTEEHKLDVLGLKVELVAFLGENKKTIEIADEILAVTKEKVTVPKIQAINGKAFAYCLIANMPECKRYIQEAEQLLAKAKGIIPKKEYDRNMMLLQYTQTGLVYFIADIPNLKKQSEELIAYAQKCKNNYFHFAGLIYLASYYMLKGENEKQLEIFEKEMPPVVKQSDNELLEITQKFMTLTFTRSKSLEEVKKKISVMEELIAAFEALGTKISLGFFYNNTAVFYSKILDTDKALEYFHKSYNLYEMSFAKTMYLSNVAWQYVIKRDYETAKGYYLQLFDYSQEIKSTLWIIGALRSLIDVTIELGEIDQAKKYLAEIKPLVDNSDEESAVDNYMICQAKILSASTKIKDWVKAQEIFEEVLTKELAESQKIAIYFTESELLIKELQMTGDEETLGKLKENIEAMKNISKDKVYTQFSINLLRLESKLALLEYQEEKAKELLQEAITQAEQYNLPKFIAEIKAEQKSLEDQKELWQVSKKKEEPLIERLEHVAISKSMKEMKEKTILEDRDKETGQFKGQQKLFAIKF